MEAHRSGAVADFFTQCQRARKTDTNMYDQKCTNLSALFVQRSIFMFIFNTGDSWNILPVRWQQYGPVCIATRNCARTYKSSPYSWSWMFSLTSLVSVGLSFHIYAACMLTPKNYCYYPCFRRAVHEQCICSRNFRKGQCRTLFHKLREVLCALKWIFLFLLCTLHITSKFLMRFKLK